MTEADLGRLAGVAADIYAHHGDYSILQSERADAAFAHHARDLPEPAAAAVLERDGIPVMALARKEGLYLLDIPELNDEHEPAETRCRFVQFDPAQIKVSSARGTAAPREAGWCAATNGRSGRATLSW